MPISSKEFEELVSSRLSQLATAPGLHHVFAPDVFARLEPAEQQKLLLLLPEQDRTSPEVVLRCEQLVGAVANWKDRLGAGEFDPEATEWLSVMQQQQQRKEAKDLEKRVRAVLPPGRTLQSYGLSLASGEEDAASKGGRKQRSAPFKPAKPAASAAADSDASIAAAALTAAALTAAASASSTPSGNAAGADAGADSVGSGVAALMAAAAAANATPPAPPPAEAPAEAEAEAEAQSDPMAAESQEAPEPREPATLEAAAAELLAEAAAAASAAAAAAAPLEAARHGAAGGLGAVEAAALADATPQCCLAGGGPGDAATAATNGGLGSALGGLGGLSALSSQPMHMFVDPTAPAPVGGPEPNGA